jgi:hypothetical protein
VEHLCPKVAALIALIIVRSYLRMKKLLTKSFLILTLLIALPGCAGSGPSPEQQAREADRQREAERQQAEFRKSLPPVSNPGQGW